MSFRIFSLTFHHHFGLCCLIVSGIVSTANPLYTVRSLLYCQLLSISPYIQAEEFAHQLEDSKAEFIITIPLFLEKVAHPLNGHFLTI